jgi:soluble lytic murein transglycosylase-like protein
MRTDPDYSCGKTCCEGLQAVDQSTPFGVIAHRGSPIPLTHLSLYAIIISTMIYETEEQTISPILLIGAVVTAICVWLLIVSPGSAVSITSCQVSSSYPQGITQWCELITRYSVKRSLDPDLVAALIWQESGGNPKALSGSGAVGLMQVMPSDGQAAAFMCASGPCFANRPPSEKLLDPEFNVSYGTKMLGSLVTKYGSLREALLHYGPIDMGYRYADKVLGIYKKYKD